MRSSDEGMANITFAEVDEGCTSWRNNEEIVKCVGQERAWVNTPWWTMIEPEQHWMWEVVKLALDKEL